MIIKQNHILKETLTKIYWRRTRVVLQQVRAAVTDKAGDMDPDRLRAEVPYLLNEKPMFDNILELWTKTGGKFGYDTDRAFEKANKSKVNSILSKYMDSDAIEYFWTKKDKPIPDLPIGVPITDTMLARGLTPAERLVVWQKRMRAYAYERSLQKAKAILTTEQEAINVVIDKVIKQASAEGLSIPNTRKLMKEQLDTELVTIENWQAERIARTEVGGAANTGSFQAATENGEGVVKNWLTSGLPNVRPSHLEYGAMGSQELDYEYSPGLKFPCDEDCQDGGETINCNCDYTLETAEEII